MKQLDMEQVDEITTSTATSTNGAAFPGQPGQLRATNNGLGDSEEPGDRDLPPLTGTGQGQGRVKLGAQCLGVGTAGIG